MSAPPVISPPPSLPVAGPSGDVEMNGVESALGTDVEGEAAVVDDPNRLPDDAIETLYIQNLNETVRLESESQFLQLERAGKMTVVQPY